MTRRMNQDKASTTTSTSPWPNRFKTNTLLSGKFRDKKTLEHSTKKRQNRQSVRSTHSGVQITI
jgi:hypothetical protein